jgi:serine acetyltransferase
VHMSSNHVVCVEEIIESDWNFTRARDVLDCNLEWLKRREAAAFIAPGAQIVDGTVLDHVVVGRGACISGMAWLRHGVVFPDTRIERAARFESVLITPGAILQV